MARVSFVHGEVQYGRETLILAYSGDDIQDANLEEKNTNAKILSAHVNVVVSLFL